MPIIRTASIDPSNACNPSSPTYSWTSGLSSTVLGTSAALSVTYPGLYTATVKCASSPNLCNTQASSYVMCYQGQQVTTSFSSVLNITVESPTGVTVQLNTVSGFSFPYANSDSGAAALKSALIAWLSANNGNGAEVIALKSGGGIFAVLSAWRFVSVTTNTGTTAFASPTCTAPTFSVSAANTSTGPPPVLGQATGTPAGCSSFVLYTWYNPSGLNVGETNPASLTRGVTYTLRAFCGDGQWASTTVNVV
jgi:hypothetical protein